MDFQNIQEKTLDVRYYPGKFKDKNVASNREICWNYISEGMKQHHSQNQCCRLCDLFHTDQFSAKQAELHASYMTSFSFRWSLWGEIYEHVIVCIFVCVL